MSEEKKYKNYTATDIEKYHKGLLSSKEMNELERAALNDPFLADALEGYAATNVNVSADLSELEKRLEERTSDKKIVSIDSSKSSFQWWKVAAAVIVLGGAGYLTYQFSTGNQNKEVAKQIENKNPDYVVPKNDSAVSTKVSSDTVNNLNIQNDLAKATSQKKKLSKPGLDSDKVKKQVTIETHNAAAGNLDYKSQTDSVNNSEIARYSTPLAVEKRKAGNNKNDLQGLAAKKESLEDDQFKTNYFRGRIADENNNPLPFANITNTKDNVGTYADAHGNFTLISPDSVLDVQVRSVGFENNVARLKNNVTSNNIVLQDNKAAPDKIISFRRPDTSRLRKNNVQFEELEPADGWNNYNTYMANNINLPEDVKRKPAEIGQVELSFDVNENGEPVNIKVEKSLCQKCDEEAIRLIKQGPKWKKKNKKAKRITITVPFDNLH